MLSTRNVTPGHGLERDETFVFVIPLRNPRDRQVADYEIVKALLRRTLASLSKQTYPRVAVVVVCHGAPEWAAECEGDVRFLDVSGSQVFQPDALHKNVDRGLRDIIGVLYALAVFDPRLVMITDADDYVNLKLAETLMADRTPAIDGYLVDKGVQVSVEIGSDHGVGYGKAYVVKRFDQVCGSCRIFKAGVLAERIEAIDPGIQAMFSGWPEPDARRAVPVAKDRIEWLWRKTEGEHQDTEGIVRVLGRHVEQADHFRLQPVDLLGAAKACGHGNHTGPRKGAIHQDKVVGTLPAREFRKTFGLPRQAQRRWWTPWIRGGASVPKRAV